MTRGLILASGSAIRLRLLQDAGLSVRALPARVDEEAIRQSLEAEQAKPRDIADALAEMKARKVAEKHPKALVLGCDQVLSFRGSVYAKPETLAEAKAQICALRGERHSLISAIVLYDAGSPIWRNISEARLTMHPVSDAYVDAYLSRNWPDVSSSVGGYKLEREGVRFFSAIEGDYFTILGLPLLPLLGYLGSRGFIET